MMSAIYAKVPFTKKTITEVLRYLSNQLNIKLNNDKEFQSKWHTYDHHCKTLKAGRNDNTDTRLCSNYTLLTFQIAYIFYFSRDF